MSFRGGRWRGPSSGQARGQARGSSWRNFYPSRPPSKVAEPPRPPSPPLGPVLNEIREEDLACSSDLQEHSAKIHGCKDITAYNWLNKSEPTILVPGRPPFLPPFSLNWTRDYEHAYMRELKCSGLTKNLLRGEKGKPPAWTPLTTSKQLREDNGNFFRDRNAARYPAHPIQPAVQAILTSQPDFPTSSVDVFACSSTLGNLLRFVRKIDKPFRMLVEAIGDTVFFVRRENSPTELIPNIRGFGHTFPEAYTTWEADVKTSESHQRVIEYSFGGLKFLVRAETDGYHKNLVPGGSEAPGGSNSAASANPDDTLAAALEESTIAGRPSAQDTKLTIIRGGQQIPQSANFDLKTRSVRKKDDDTLAGELPRLWVAQIPNFILAHHASGVFEDIQTQNVRREIDDWENENEGTLRRFAFLLREIVAFARAGRVRKFEVRRRDVDMLELREQGEGVCSTLSPDVEARWIAGESTGEKSSGEDFSGGDQFLSDGANDHHRSDSDNENDGDDWDEGSEKDFTACSAEDCGYCGHCTY